ncbi:DUF3156 family protein [Providencia alcalifaciens]|uniref:DUF3156 family protein n=1 Tax=Providencia alcalifaciens TaxID=126385 RepID=UPI000E41618E|nr:DUF3156 family protein [Providencia alcalifaciens]MTC51649.1 DUF3156 family protein [Providencia alcalifaciens]
MSLYVTLPKLSWWKKLTQKRLPTGYQAGLTLNRIEKDIAPYVCEWGAPGVLLIQLPQGIKVEVTERVKTLFMAFIVHSRFAVSGKCDSALVAQIDVKTAGSARKKQVRFTSQQADGQPFIESLEQYPVIRQTFEELDFTYCHIAVENGVWRCEIEPYTASEMVSRIPTARRYLRLTNQQRHRLLSALQLISQLITQHVSHR